MIGVTEVLSNFIITAVEQLGYYGIFIGMGLGSACIPIPSEIIMPFSGYIAWEGKLNIIAVIFVGASGCLVGSLLAYSAGRYGGRPFLEKYGRYVLIRKHEIDRAHEWFERHGEMAIFLSRMLPVIRAFISLPAGIAKMDVKKFSVYTFLGSLPWCFALASAGILLGQSWRVIGNAFTSLGIAVLLVVIAILGYVTYRRRKDTVSQTQS
jgi:membrane protein DedA with SNARE-associated domain